MKEINNIYRNVYCGYVSSDMEGKEIRIAGWVNSIRKLGGLTFLTLRDETGIVQAITEDTSLIDRIVKESTVTITGIVHLRTPEMINKNMKTGEVEVEIKSIEVLGECLNTLPFETSRSREASEETRLKYR